MHSTAENGHLRILKYLIDKHFKVMNKDVTYMFLMESNFTMLHAMDI